MSRIHNGTMELFDTPQRQVVPIETASGQLTMYTCGPTVYKDAHVGNMRAYVTADLIRRAGNVCGVETRQVINITDVGHLTSDADEGEDKVTSSASKLGLTAWDVAKRYEERFWEDADALGIARPEVIARATEHIDEQIDLVRQLARRGITYTTQDGVYFDSSRFPEYGDFARLDVQGLRSGARVQFGDKRNPHDFALWKFSPTNEQREMEWDSPWGKGFPGWHLECSAMAMRYLGTSFDIHTGGIDHIPIHHTNEIAQAKGAGYDFARHWAHTAFLINGSGQKMSKSSGVSSRLPQVTSHFGITPNVIRYMYLTQHYRNELAFDEERVKQAHVSIDRILDSGTVLAHQAAENTADSNRAPSAQAETIWNNFTETFVSDINTPGALDILHGMLKAKRISATEKSYLLEAMDNVLGLGIKDGTKEVTLTDNQTELLDRRAQARAARDFIASDNLRDALHAEGIKVIDAAGNTQLVRRV